MKKLVIGSLLLISACASHPNKNEGVQSATQTPFHIRAFEQETLPNGLQILWIPDDSLPYVSLQMMVKTGSSEDPSGKEGLASLTAGLLERGTNKRSAPKIAEDLEQIGSSFDIEVQPDYIVTSASALTPNRDNILGQFEEILLKPSFPKSELERQRKMTLAGLNKLPDHAESFAQFVFPQFLYGKHPYGHTGPGTPKSVAKITRQDVMRFYKEHFSPSNSVLAVTGQFDAAWKKKVEEGFSSWSKTAEVSHAIPEFPQWKGVEVLLVDRPDLQQAQIEIGFKGVARKVPEYMDIRAALKILGESFGSRLFDEIRVKRGLTYGIYSWFDPRFGAGPMGIYTFTRVEKVGETVRETLNTYRNFVSGGVTDEEVTTVKALMRGQFPRTFETPEALARQLLILVRYDIPVDYLKNYYATLEKVNKASVNAAIKKYFDPQNLRVLVYAPRKAAEESLKSVGKLEVKNYKEFLQ